MKTAALLVAASLLLSSSIVSSTALAQSSMSSSVPPPPGIDDPGVKASVPATRSSSQAQPSSAVPADPSLDLKPVALPAMKSGDSTLGRSAGLPEVRVHQEGDNMVQEYLRSGRVYMVVVTPKSGIAQTYMVDPQGRLVDEHGQKPTGPVMYKVLEWGKSRPAAAASTGEADEQGN